MARFVPMAVGAVALLLLGQWLLSRPTHTGLTARVPGQDHEQIVPPALIDLKNGQLTAGTGKAAEVAGEWPGFRGVNLDGISSERVPLAREWGQQGPKRLWTQELAEGYAGAAVRNGRVYVLDYDTQAQADTLRCLSLADGKEIWRRAYHVEVGRNHGITRTVPAVTEDCVVTLGPKCHVVCLDAASGEYRWSIDLVREHGASVPEWYAGQCPLIDQGKVVLGVGGSSLVMAVDLKSGMVLWQSANPRKWKMTHSSIVPMEFNGVRMYVYCGSGGVAGVSAEDGRILWETSEWKVTMATVPSPVIVPPDRIFLTGGYGAGSMMIRLEGSGFRVQGSTAPSLNPEPRTPNPVVEAKILFRLKPEVFGADQQTPILYEGHVYGIIPGGQLACLDLEGKRLWASGGRNRFGLGPLMIADGMILALSESGALNLVEATSEGYRPVARAGVIDEGHEAWGPMALVGGRLICRDLTRMVCVDLRKDSHE